MVIGLSQLFFFKYFFVQDVNIVNKSDQSETTYFMGVTLF